MAVFPFSYVNTRGIPVIATTDVTVNTDNVTFTFPNHAFVNTAYRGIVFIKIEQTIPTGTTTTLPIYFQTNGSSIAVTKVASDPVTVADIAGTGVYQVYYDKTSNTLQLMTGTI